MVMTLLRVLEETLYGVADGLSRVLPNGEHPGEDPLTNFTAPGEARSTTRAWPRLSPAPGGPTAA
jgi:hypothetical protein